MPYVGNPLATAFSGRLKQDLTGGSGTSFTLSHAVSSPNDLSIYINHIRQEPTTAYTVNGTALTMTGSVAGTDDFYIIYDELATQSISHPANQALTATAGTFTSGLVGTTATFSGAVSGTTGTFSSAFTSPGIDDNANATAITIDSNENVGLGTTSPNVIASGNTHLDIRSGTYSFLEVGTTGTTTTSDVGYLEFMNGNNNRLATIAGGADGANNDGYMRFATLKGGSFTEQMRINHDGNVGIGTTTPRNNLDFGVTSNNDHVIALRDNNTSRTILGLSNGYGVRVAAPHDGTSTETIFEVGEIAGDGTTYQNAKFNIYYNGQFRHTAQLNSLAGYIVNEHGSSPYGIYIQFDSASPNNTDNYFLSGLDSSATRIKLYSSGTVKNSTGTYTSFSDERLKSDIVDAKSQWEDIKALNFKNFIKFDNPDFKQLGLIAQDVEKVSPNLVFETPPEPEEIKHSSVFGTLYKDGDELPEGKKIGDVKEVKSKVKNVKDSILYMKSVKALQEAMERIEILEAKVKVLENK